LCQAKIGHFDFFLKEKEKEEAKKAQNCVLWKTAFSKKLFHAFFIDKVIFSNAISKGL
jgi:hypothetical protein